MHPYALIIALVLLVITYFGYTRSNQSHNVNPSLFELRCFWNNKWSSFHTISMSVGKLQKFGDDSNNYVFNEVIQEILDKLNKPELKKDTVCLQHKKSSQIITNTKQLQDVVMHSLDKNIHIIDIRVFEWGHNLK